MCVCRWMDGLDLIRNCALGADGFYSFIHPSLPFPPFLQPLPTQGKTDTGERHTRRAHAYVRRAYCVLRILPAYRFGVDEGEDVRLLVLGVVVQEPLQAACGGTKKKKSGGGGAGRNEGGEEKWWWWW